MKHLIVIFMLTPLISFGQEFNVGIKAGISYNLTESELRGYSGKRGFINFAGGIYAGLDVKKFMFSIGTDYGMLKQQYTFMSKNVQFPSPPTSHHTEIPFTYVHFAASYKTTGLPHRFIYFGPNAGLFFPGDEKQTTRYLSNSQEYSYSNSIKAAIAAGIQFGYSAKLARSLHLRAETGVRFITLRRQAGPASHIFYIPATVGLNYSL